MRVSSKGRYALRMMIDIAEHNTGTWISIKYISKRQGISVKYLEQIVTNLCKSGMLKSSRGPQGGYMLSRSPDLYTAGQILRIMEGSLAPVVCLEDEENQCTRKSICPTLTFWKGLDKVIGDYVDSITLQDLCDSNASDDGWGFSI
jgi:Rrf2 family protein